jgi:hypothetical protein
MVVPDGRRIVNHFIDIRLTISFLAHCLRRVREADTPRLLRGHIYWSAGGNEGINRVFYRKKP